MNLKHLLLNGLLFLLTATLSAQVIAPQGLTYQAAIRDQVTGAIITGNVRMRFSILSTSGGPSTVVYQEEETLSPNAFGIINHVIGTGIVLNGNFSTIDWGNEELRLFVEIDVDNSGNYLNMGTTKFQSVPYSFYADRAGSVDNLDVPLDSLLNVNISNPVAGDILRWDDNLGQWVNGPDMGGSGTALDAGRGIAIVNDTIINTGDTLADDDITIGSLAGGDLSDTFPNPRVSGLLGFPIEISTAIPLDSGDVLKWNPDSARWEAQPDNVASGGGGLGVNVSPRLRGDGTIPNPLDLAKNGATLDQVLRWDGNTWTPADQDEYTISRQGSNLLVLNKNGQPVSTVTLTGINYIGGDGIDITGNVITNTGDTLASDDLTIGTDFEGDVTGKWDQLRVERIQGTPISPLSPSQDDILRFGSSGEWELVPDGSLSDFDKDPTNEIQSLTISGFNLGITGVPGTIPLPQYIAGNGIQIIGNLIQNSGDLDPNDDILENEAYPAFPATDLSGFYKNPRVIAIQGQAVSSTNPTPNQVLRYVNGQWVPSDANDADSTNELQSLFLIGDSLGMTKSSQRVRVRYQGGTGIQVDNNTYSITNTGDLDPSDDLLRTDNFQGDVTGPFNNTSVVRLRGDEIVSTQPNNGQVLRYVNGQWVPSPDDQDNTNELQAISLVGDSLRLSRNGGRVRVRYQAGSGIAVDNNNYSISNTGDLDPDDDIKIGDPAFGDLGGNFPNLTLDSLQGKPLNAFNPSNGQILKFNSGIWQLSGDDVIDDDNDPSNEIQELSIDNDTLTLSNGGGNVTLPIYLEGSGIDIINRVINNTGDLDGNDDINIGDPVQGGDIGGNFPTLSLDALNGQPFAKNTPSTNDVLKWNGLQWVASPDSTIDGDNDDQNEIQQLQFSGGILSLNNGGNSVGIPDDVVDSDADPTNELQELVVFDDSIMILPLGNKQALPVYTAGDGISIVNRQITNTGDRDPNNDITNTTNALGDLQGQFPDLRVVGIDGNEVDAASPNQNQILKYNGSQWVPDSDLVDDADADPSNEFQTLSINVDTLTLSDGNAVTLPSNVAGAGIDITGRIIINTGDTLASDDITKTSLAAGDVNGFFDNLVVVGLQGVEISNQNPLNSQVLKYRNGQWVPFADSVNDADADPGNEIQAISIVGDTISLSKGGGSLVLPDKSLVPGAGIDITGNVISNIGDLDPNDDITETSLAGGDVNGTFDSLKVVGIQKIEVSTTLPNPGEILKYNGNQWIPTPDLVDDGDTEDTNELQNLSIDGDTITISRTNTSIVLEPYTAGDGISINNKVIANTGDLDPTDDLTDTTQAGGDLSGRFNNLTVEGIQGNPISNATPVPTEVLKWNGSEWEASRDSVEDADANPTNELQNLSLAGRNLSISSGNTITLPDSVNDDDSNPSNELQNLSFVGRALSISNGNSVSIPDSVEDDDSDPSNEIQTLSNVGRSITLSGANTITLPDSVNDDDSNPSNELQNLSFVGRTLSISNGNSVSIPDSVEDDDSDPTNEFQTLSLSGLTLSISNGNSITVPNIAYVGGTGIDITGNVITNTGDTDPSNDVTDISQAGGDVRGVFSNLIVERIQGNPISSSSPSASEVFKWSGSEWEAASDSVEDDDADPSNEIQTLSNVGRSITISGANTITLPDSVNDADSNPSNELQSLSLVGRTLSISSGNSVSLPDSVEDDDADPSNELQNLSIIGTTLSISGGNSLTIPTTQYFGGSGIGISGDTIINLGDTNAGDDLLVTTNAGGDVNGNFDSLNVNAIQGNPVESGLPNVDDVLQWNGSQWALTQNQDRDTTNEIQTISLLGNQLSISKGNTITLPGGSAGFAGGAGISIDTANIITNTGDLDDSDDIVDTTLAGGDVDGNFANLNVNALQGNPLSPSAPSASEVLKWNGLAWIPAADSVNDADADPTNEFQTLGIAGRTLSISNGNSINLPDSVEDADADPSNEIQNLSNVGRSISISGGNTITLPDSVNDADADPFNEVQNLSLIGRSLSISGGNTVTLQDSVVDDDADPSNEIQVLSITGDQLSLSGANTVTIPTDVYTGGAGIAISSNEIINLGDLDDSDDIVDTTQAGGDLDGTFDNINVNALQGSPVAVTAPSATEVLKWNGIAWEPATDSVDDADADPANELQDLSINNDTLALSGSGDIVDFTEFIKEGETAAGDLDGTFAAPTVDGLQGNPVAATAPSATEVLKWNGIAWEPATDSVDDADADPANELQDLSINNDTLALSGSGDIVDFTEFIKEGETAAGDLDGIFAAPTVDGLQGNPVAATTPDNGEVLLYDGTNWTPDSLGSSALRINSSLVPDAASSYNLGSAATPFDSLFLTAPANIVSDARLKKNIEPLAYGIQELMNLQPVSYEMNHKAVGQRQLGLLAQDVEQVIGEVVSKHNGKIVLPDGSQLEGGHYGLSYTELIPVIIKGIQEQQDAIERQETIIEQQAQMIELLQQQLDLLKKESAEKN